MVGGAVVLIAFVIGYIALLVAIVRWMRRRLFQRAELRLGIAAAAMTVVSCEVQPDAPLQSEGAVPLLLIGFLERRRRY